MNFYKLKVDIIKVETEDTKSVFFKIPIDLKEEFAHVSGQYLTIKVKIDGKEYRRAYSIPNAPDESELGITIKRVDSGVVSNYINDTLKVGDEIAVASPLGAFVYKLPDQGIQPNYLLVAAGSGITPIMSILKTVLIKEVNKSKRIKSFCVTNLVKILFCFRIEVFYFLYFKKKVKSKI
jgi:ring-1,2-phenylacetyl-CoA epoxidase subunit PaaE